MHTAHLQPQVPDCRQNDLLHAMDGVKKDELVRLLLQSLQDLGFRDSAAALEKESGICLESRAVLDFRKAVCSGDWPTAESLLPSLIREDSLNLARFKLRRQRFLELLESQKMMDALHLLQRELTPLGQNVKELHNLTSYILCTSAEDIKQQAGWDGAKGESRYHLLEDLQGYTEPSMMVPKNRLPTLFSQAFAWQRRQCLYHRLNGATYSLLFNHQCDKNQFPTTVTNVLSGHTDEVWYMEFSHSGKYLASVSKDRTCLVWDMETFDIVQKLKIGQSATYCAWSPDDSKLLVCDSDRTIYLWDPMTGKELHQISDHEQPVTSCVWLKDNQHFISGACDYYLRIWNVDGILKLEFNSGRRVLGMDLSQDGRRLVTTSNEMHIDVFAVRDLKLVHIMGIKEEGFITSLSLDYSGRFALVSVRNLTELHLWDLDAHVRVHNYSGHLHKEFVIRSAFGGDDQGFILSGSEDNCIYVWNREHENLLEVLQDHKGIVNCVTWCPSEPARFASASDDRTIRIWGIKQASPSSSSSSSSS